LRVAAAHGVVIVGSGQAGVAAALALRATGFPGPVLLLGDEAHLPYERPLLSKAVLTEDAAALPALHEAAELAAQGLVLRPGERVEAIDTANRTLTLASGERLGYGELLLATGGRARVLAAPGGEHALTLRSYDDALHLRVRLRAARHVTVVGAGVIGLEVASSARQLGCEVAVLEAGERPMARALPPAMGDLLAEWHRQAGVDLRFGAQLQAVEHRADGRFDVITSDGRLGTDLVVAGIGLQPNVELAAAAGVAIGTGVLVDELGRTDVPGVHAAGDVAELWHPRYGQRLRLESWLHASRHAEAVARTLAGTPTRYDEVPWFWSDQHEVNLQVLGLPLLADRSVLRGDPDRRSFTALHLRAGRLVGATLVNQGREMRPCKALIESGAVLDASRLADAAQPLRQLAAEAAA
jgi:3-phenylpropionate/trans-cinnamate dioxygenase ferredoxin reductase subunit